MEKKRINYARSAGRGRDERPFSLREGRGGEREEGRRGRGKRRKEEGRGSKVHLFAFPPPTTLRRICFLLCVRHCLDPGDTVLSGRQSTSLEARILEGR